MNSFYRWINVCLFLFCLISVHAFADDITAYNIIHLAQNSTINSSIPDLLPPEPDLAATGYALMDANTGKLLAQKNMNQRMSPASLTKMMTLYLTFQALKNGQIHLNDKVNISKEAWSMSGSRMFIKVGSNVTVEELIQGIVVASGNDACVALAQYIAGTEGTFAHLMNQMAAKLGMLNTHYVDSTGMPNNDHYSTPYDMTILARAIIRDFPQYYHYFKEKWFTYNNIKQPNRNRLLWRDNSVDGLKTGHTDEAGFCLVASAVRNNMRLISVIMGAPTDSMRANNAEALLNFGFRFYKTYELFPAGKQITNARVWLGQDKFVSLGLEKPLNVTVSIGAYNQLKAKISINNRLIAPINHGKSYGNITIMLNKQIIATKPLVALQDDPSGGVFSRILDRITLLTK